jgi:hypothetical protein
MRPSMTRRDFLAGVPAAALALGEDLMRFVIGETVEVLPWSGRP